MNSKKREVPVFFIHTGNQEYLKKTVSQAEKYNKQVYLFGDDSNVQVAKNWVCLEEYLTDRYAQFCKIYKHMSTNLYEFELGCFKRFFVSYEFAKRNNIKEFMMLDSDLMTFVDYSTVDFHGCCAGFSMPADQSHYIWTASPHCSYWKTEAIDDFLEFLFYEYTQGIKELEEKWCYHQKYKVPGGICDMTLLYLWSKSKKNADIFNTAEIVQDTVFDHFLSVSEGFHQGDFKVNKYCQMKVLKFENNIPYFKTSDGKWIRAYSIHAQGRSKLYISALYKQKTGMFYYALIKTGNYFERIFRKIKRSIK